MRKLVGFLLIVFLTGNYQQATAFSFGSIFDIGSIVKDIINTIADVVGVFIPQKMAPDHFKEYKQFENDLLDQNDRLQHIYRKADDAANRTALMEQKLAHSAKFFKDIEVRSLSRDLQVMDMMNRIDDFVKRTSVLTYSINEMLTTQVNDTARRLNIMSNLDTRMKDLHEYISEISDTFDQLMERVNQNEEMSITRFRELLRSIVSFKPKQPRDIMNKMRKLFNPGETSSLYDSLLNYFTDFTGVLEFSKKCNLESTYQDKLKSIYNMVMITELRAFMMLVVSYRFSAIAEPEKNVYVKNDVNLFVEELMKKSTEYIKIMKRAFKKIPSDIMRCDPQVHLKDDTSFEMTNLFGSYYMNVAQLNKKCIDSCDSIDVKRQLECVDANSDAIVHTVPRYCPQFQCNGRLHNCYEANNAHFCEARIAKEQRYKWIMNNVNESMIENCDGTYVNTMTNTKCSSCLCQCSAEGAESDATRAVSLLPQISDFKRNMVVTNVRFQKKNNMAHVQIQQGRLLPEGRIERGTLSWVPLKDFVYARNTVDGSFSMVEDNDMVPLIPNINYTFLSYDNRKVMLNDVKVSSNHVVTGVRFQFMNNKQGESTAARKLYIEVHSTKFDYFTGDLLYNSDEAHEWVNAMTSPYRYGHMHDLTEVNLEGRDDPMKSTHNDIPSEPNQFVLLRPSGDQNSGQVTIPFFDARPAGIASRTALSGVGIFHRGSRGYGGFLALKLIGMDHSDSMTFSLSPEKLENYKWL